MYKTLKMHNPGRYRSRHCHKHLPSPVQVAIAYAICQAGSTASQLQPTSASGELAWPVFFCHFLLSLFCGAVPSRRPGWMLFVGASLSNTPCRCLSHLHRNSVPRSCRCTERSMIRQNRLRAQNCKKALPRELKHPCQKRGAGKYRIFDAQKVIAAPLAAALLAMDESGQLEATHVVKRTSPQFARGCLQG